MIAKISHVKYCSTKKLTNCELSAFIFAKIKKFNIQCFARAQTYAVDPNIGSGKQRTDRATFSVFIHLLSTLLCYNIYKKVWEAKNARI